jgi:hypothetical protein
MGATIACQPGWLSAKVEDFYDKTRKRVRAVSENRIDKTRDAIK